MHATESQLTPESVASAAPARLLLSGYYGFDNFGDEAILELFVREWRARRPADTIRVLTQSPARAQALGVQAVPRAAVAQIGQILRETDVFVSGGGGLLQTSTSLRSLLYYTSLIHEAKAAGAKTAIFAQGVGPLSFTGKLIVGRTCSQVDLAVVRDQASGDLLRHLLPRVDVRVASDPVFLTATGPETRQGGQDPALAAAQYEAAERRLADDGISGAAPLVAVVVRPSRALDKIAGDVAKAVDLLAGRDGAQVVFVPFQRQQDVEAAISIIRRCRSSPVLVEGGYDLTTMTLLFRRCTAVIGMRLHSLILAARLGVPFVAVPYDPKIVALVDNLRYPLPSLQPGNAAEVTARLWSQREELSAHVRAAAIEQEKKASQAFDWLQQLVEGAVS